MSHARLSPSSAPRWMICAAAPSREAGLPDTNSPASMMGSNGHALLEEMVLGTPVELPYPDVAVSVEVAKMAADCYAYAKRRQKEMKPAALRAETKVDPGYFTGRTDGKGTGDVLIVSQDMLEVIDLKTGGRYVDATDPQFKIYALGAMAQYIKDGKVPFKTIRLTVFQPRRPASATQIERYIDMTPEELMTWCEETYIPAAARTDIEGVKGTPHDDVCHFCKARGTCPDISEAMFMSPINTGGDLLMSDKAIAEMTVDELSAFLDLAPILKARIKDAEERANQLLKDRVPVPHWKLVRGNSSRKWAVDEETLEAKCRELKIPIAKFAPRSFLSPPQMQKLGLKVDKWQALETLTEVKAGGLTLAPESDPRENAVPTELFEPIADTSWLN